MPGHDIVAIGASAGGVEALVQLVSRLPRDLPAAVFVVLHIPAHTASRLPRILERNGSLPALHPRHGDPIEHGRIYVAPPDQHLLVEQGRIVLAHGPRENGHRPAVDPLFRTAARAYGPRVVGVVVSGMLDDGTAGLAAIKLRGGTAVVQDPEEALFSGMPRSAIENVAVDHCLSLAEIGPLLARLAREPVSEEGAGAVPEKMDYEADIVELSPARVHGDERPGTPSGYACPECNGGLLELRDGELSRYRCRVGHAYSSDSLLAAQSQSLEAALWTALRALEEKSALARRLVERAAARGQRLAAERFAEQAEVAEQRAELVRRALLSGEGIPTPEPAAQAGAPAGSG